MCYHRCHIKHIYQVSLQALSKDPSFLEGEACIYWCTTTNIKIYCAHRVKVNKPSTLVVGAYAYLGLMSPRKILRGGSRRQTSNPRALNNRVSIYLWLNGLVCKLKVIAWTEKQNVRTYQGRRNATKETHCVCCTTREPRAVSAMSETMHQHNVFK